MLLILNTFNRVVAATHYKEAIDLANNPNSSLEAIEVEVNIAIDHVPADIYYTALSRINFLKAQRAAAATLGSPEENRANFEDAVRKSIEAGRKAVDANPRSYQNWVALGIIYSALVPAPLEVDGAYENALTAFNEASKRNPFNPQIPLLLAELELSRNNIDVAKALLSESIRLKEDYAEAYLIAARLALAQNNLAEGIVIAERLSLIVPGNAGLHFDLGVLKYTIGDFEGALQSFSNALVLVPDYANARYYLGLTLVRLGRFEEALENFESLLIANSDNEELTNIIENLRLGRDPL